MGPPPPRLVSSAPSSSPQKPSSSEGTTTPAMTPYSDTLPPTSTSSINAKASTSSTAKPVVSSKQGAVNPRKMQPRPLKSGFGLADWNILKRSRKPLAQRKNITWEEIREHSSKYDCWVVIRGLVYDVTAYLAYHPGGVEILAKCGGKDCTKEYDKFHPWVNVGGMIGSCCVGTVE